MIEKQKLAEIVGGANVSDDAATLDAYSKDMSFVNQTRPAYVVKPQQRRRGEAVGRARQRDPHSAGAGQLRPASFPGRHGAEHRGGRHG